jgi:hypothetical protein
MRIGMPLDSFSPAPCGGVRGASPAAKWAFTMADR